MATIHPNYVAPQGAIQLTQQQQAAAQRAFDTWETTLQNDIDIYVTVLAVQLAGNLEGQCIPNLVQGDRNGVDITVTTAQGNALGTQPFAVQTDPNNPDMVIFVNSTSQFNYGDIPNGNTHFQTMILHELCHGLGFLGLCNVALNPNIGIFSDTNLIQALQPLQTLIPFWGQLNALNAGLPTLFAQAFVNNLTHTPAYGNPPNILYTLFTTPDSMYINTIPVPPNLAQQYLVYTPNQFRPFTSCDHINYDSNTGCLMYYTLRNNIIVAPDYRTKGILRTIGWNVAP